MYYSNQINISCCNIAVIVSTGTSQPSSLQFSVDRDVCVLHIIVFTTTITENV